MKRLKKIEMILGIMLSIMPFFMTAQSDTAAVALDTLPPMATGYDWLSYRGKAILTDTGGTRSFNFNMVNRVDSILYLNIHASGIELVRVVCTPDSITYVNKLTYQYYKGTYQPLRLLSRIPVDFKMLQALFNGNTESLPQKQKLAFEYRNFVALDSTSSFFTEMTFKDLDHLVEIDAALKLVRLNVPGPTSIRIPEKFEELKF